MFAKKEKEQPNRAKINMTISRCKDTIQEMLNNYEVKIEGYLTKMVNLKKEKRLQESDRIKQKLKVVLANQTKMNNLYDQVEQFEFIINEAFAKYNVSKTLSTVFNETNKINMSPEIKKMLKDLNNFEKTFSNTFSRFDSIFEKTSKSMSGIDESSYAQDAEIEAIVNGRLDDYDEETTKQARAEMDSVFDFNN